MSWMIPITWLGGDGGGIAAVLLWGWTLTIVNCC